MLLLQQIHTLLERIGLTEMQHEETSLPVFNGGEEGKSGFFFSAPLSYIEGRLGAASSTLGSPQIRQRLQLLGVTWIC